MKGSPLGALWNRVQGGDKEDAMETQARDAPWAELGEPPWDNNADALLLRCPICQGSYQHHGEVTVFERVGGEDGPSYTIKPGSLVRALSEANPSPRRGAIRVTVTGECDHTWHLDIVQHKGQTFLLANPA